MGRLTEFILLKIALKMQFIDQALVLEEKKGSLLPLVAIKKRLNSPILIFDHFNMRNTIL